MRNIEEGMSFYFKYKFLKKMYENYKKLTKLRNEKSPFYTIAVKDNFVQNE